MFTCIYVLVSICVAGAFEIDDLNVGTVLFTSSDVKKTHWTSTEMSLLRARRHFQAMIPPPSNVNINDKFATSFLTFVKESYASLKKASKDASTEKIMNAALSDTLGGFMKVWVLPVIKFAYYGGTVSQAQATEIFQLYEDIKLCLNTNGSSWKLPNPNLLSYMSISIAPVHVPSAKRAHNPCDNIAFFEETANGLAVPVPKVIWSQHAEYIFIPLKNISIIPLRDPFTNSLLKYYDSAKNCIKTRKRAKEEQLEDESSFENRFQTWLEKEVVPHLNDDCLYPALGSVLTLVNKSISLIDAMVDAMALDTNKMNYSQKWLADLHILVSSKKMLLVAVILILELICCVPVIFCFCYNRYKKPKKPRRHNKDSMYVEYETYKGLTGAVTDHCGTQYSTSVKSVSIQNSNTKEEYPKLPENYAQALKDEFGTIGETSKVLLRNDSSNKNGCARPSNSFKILTKENKVNEKDHKKTKHQGAGTTSNFTNQTRAQYFASRNISCSNSRNTYYRSSNVLLSEVSNLASETSLSTVQSLEPNKTVTLFKNTDNYRKIETVTSNKSIQERAKCTSAARDVIQELMSKVSKCENENISQEILVASTLLDVDTHASSNAISPDNMTLIKTLSPPKSSKSRTICKSLNKKVKEYPKKLVEIKIDGHRDIAFDIGNGETVEYTYKTRQSKIPKRVNDSSKNQSLLPRRKALDVYGIDNAIDKKSSRSEERKLNSTF